MNEQELIGRIYEAAVVTDAWPEVLAAIAARAGARGTLYMARSPRALNWVASPDLAPFIEEYMASGWGADGEHAAPLLREQWPGLRAEVDYRTPAEIAALPVHRNFLDPRGFVASVGTVFQGAGDDALQLTLEGFPDHGAARRALPALDRLRPHLGRALSLAARLRDARDAATVAALEAAGVGAAVVDAGGRLRAANARFDARLGDMMIERRGVLAFTDAFLDASLRAAVDNRSGVRSVVTGARGDVGETPFAMHLVPLERHARERAESDGVLLLIAEPGNAGVPDADLLRLLFDLTPAEARLARRIAVGEPLAVAAHDLGIAEATARAQLRAVFAKTGVQRQAELVRLLAGLALPVGQAG